MGVPAFFRWLSKKYPSIVVHCVEEKPKEINGERVPVDCSKTNPNDIEFDNLYLDMNGIIHPCCHPEDKPEPKNEDEMMVLIFEYIDRIFSVVRPRRLLYMAIDGVAPRAKMNQQRSRRFRASKESADKAKMMTEMRAQLEGQGRYLPPTKPATERFDSNCITPGTPFMFRLANCLRYYIHDRLNNDPGWKDIKVILSDANVPGEGEHKIMDYIRRQRAQPNHDPNTKHCLCGADADLIMLGLATHEASFTIIREEFKPNQQKDKPCDLCGQLGHEMKNCEGLPKEMAGEHDEMPKLIGQECEFIFLRLPVLREYLKIELKMDNLPFEYDFERALDDWVFMCFFVGNDFLPHLPSLEIREGAIDRLVKLYKNAVYKTGGYLTDSGVVALERVQLIMAELGQMEDQIFKTRRTDDLNFKARMKARNSRGRGGRNQMGFRNRGGLLGAVPVGRGGGGGGYQQSGNLRQQAYQMRRDNMATSSNPNQELNQLRNQVEGNKKDDEDDEPVDDVRLWEDGWKNRYYSQKFDVDENDIAFRHTVANHYVRGLCWVLRYYYQGCASWKWYFPYHYAPFASDFVNIGDLPNDFERNTQPFQPMEQLMSVFPAASKKHLPPTWQKLMFEPQSNIIDFYPINFKIDLNGKKYAWQGVALLPFVDETRLHKALEAVYPDLTPDERKRNILGADKLFVGSSNPAYNFFEGLYEGGGPQSKQQALEIETSHTKGMAGTVWCDTCRVETGGVVMSPLDALPDLKENQTICVQYHDPVYEAGFLFKAKVLPGAVFETIKLDDFERRNSNQRNWNQNQNNQRYRPQLGFTPQSGYRQNSDVTSAIRMIRNSTGMGNQGFVMSSQSMMPSFVPARSAGGGGGGGQNRNGQNSGGGSRNNSYGGRSGWGGNVAQQQSAYDSNQSRYRPLPTVSDQDSYTSYRSGGSSSGAYGSGSRQGGSGGYGGYSGGGGGGAAYGSGYGGSGYGGQDRSGGGRRPLSGGYGDGSWQDRSQRGGDDYQRYEDQRQSHHSRGRGQQQDRYRPY